MDIGPGMPKSKAAGEGARPTLADPDLYPAQAEEILQELAGVFTQNASIARRIVYPPEESGPALPRTRSFPIWKPGIAPWSSRFQPSYSWPISIAALARPT